MSICEKLVSSAALCLAFGSVAFAQSEKPVAPQYYLDTVLSMSLADQYTANCQEVELDQDAMAVQYGQVLEKLAKDGIPTDAPHEHMRLPPVSETDGVIFAMLARHENKDDPEASFCQEAMSEISVQSLVGTMIKVRK